MYVIFFFFITFILFQIDTRRRALAFLFDQIVILKATSVLEEHKKDMGITSRIILNNHLKLVRAF
jgi:hypothetical protein